MLLNNEIKQAIIRSVVEGFCANVLLPVWYLIIKIDEAKRKRGR